MPKWRLLMKHLLFREWESFLKNIKQEKCQIGILKI